MYHYNFDSQHLPAEAEEGVRQPLPRSVRSATRFVLCVPRTRESFIQRRLLEDVQHQTFI